MSLKTPLEKRLAVLIVDMQEICTSDLGASDKKIIVNSQLEIIDYCENKDIPTVLLEFQLTPKEKLKYPDISSKLGKTIKEIDEPVKNIPRLKYIHKTENDGFSNKELNKQLLSWGSKYLLFTGIFASLCVRETARSAIDHNFHILTAKTLIANRGGGWISTGWYKENGIYFDDHKELLKYISKAN